MSAVISDEPRGVVEIAREMVELFEEAKANLARAGTLAAELHNAATGDVGPKDVRVQRFSYALGEDARAWAPTYLRDAQLIAGLDEAHDAAVELLELAEAACEARKEVAA